MTGIPVCKIRYVDNDLFQRDVYLLPKAPLARFKSFEALTAHLIVKHANL